MKKNINQQKMVDFSPEDLESLLNEVRNRRPTETEKPEIEFRFRGFNSEFGVGFKSFERVRKHFSNLGSFNFLETKEILYPFDYRQITEIPSSSPSSKSASTPTSSPLTTSIPTTATTPSASKGVEIWRRKDKIRELINSDYRVRLVLSLEKDFPSSSQIDARNAKPLSSRRKKRWSLIIGNTRLDLTIVETISFKNPDVKSLSYEVELELLDPSELKERKFLPLVNSIVSKIQGTEYLYPYAMFKTLVSRVNGILFSSQKLDVLINQVINSRSSPQFSSSQRGYLKNQLLGWISDIRRSQTQGLVPKINWFEVGNLFPPSEQSLYKSLNNIINLFFSQYNEKTSFPIFNRHVLYQSRNLHYNDLVYGGIVGNPDEVYKVTFKTDGIRKLGVVTESGFWLISPPDEANLIYPASQLKNLNEYLGMVVEGEYLPPEYPEFRTQWAPEAKHLFYLFDVLANPISGRQSPGIEIANFPHTVRMEAADEFRSNFSVHSVDVAPTGSFRERSGVQLQSENSYFQLHTKKFQSFTTPSEFFSVIRQFERMKPLLSYVTDGYIFTPDKMSYFSGNDLRPLKERILTSVPDICKWKPTEMLTIDFSIGWTRSDKTRTGYQIVLQSTKEGQLINFEAFGYDPEKSSPDPKGLLNVPNGTIVEFKWDSDRRIFVPFRIRTDKSSPNELEYARDNFFVLSDAILLDTLEGNDFELMKKEHNRIKKNLFDSVEPSNSLIDLGSGRGGDLSKWKKFSKILAVEPNRSSIDEFLIPRARTILGISQVSVLKPEDDLTNLNTNARLLVLESGAENTDFITRVRQKYFGNRVDCISMMLSLSFFWKSESMLDSLIQTLVRNLSPTGQFIFLTIDSDALLEMFEPVYQQGYPISELFLGANKISLFPPNSMIEQNILSLSSPPSAQISSPPLSPRPLSPRLIRPSSPRSPRSHPPSTSPPTSPPTSPSRIRTPHLIESPKSEIKEEVKIKPEPKIEKRKRTVGYKWTEESGIKFFEGGSLKIGLHPESLESQSQPQPEARKVYFDLKGTIAENQIEYLVSIPDLCLKLAPYGFKLFDFHRATSELLLNEREKIVTALYSSGVFKKPTDFRVQFQPTLTWDQVLQNPLDLKLDKFPVGPIGIQPEPELLVEKEVPQAFEPMVQGQRSAKEIQPVISSAPKISVFERTKLPQTTQPTQLPQTTQIKSRGRGRRVESQISTTSTSTPSISSKQPSIFQSMIKSPAQDDQLQMMRITYDVQKDWGIGDDEVEEIQCTWYHEFPVVRIAAIGKGSCLFHSILKAYSKKYNQSRSYEFRKTMVKNLRTDISETLSMKDPKDPEGKNFYQTYEQGLWSSISLDDPNSMYSLKNLQQLMNSDIDLGDEFYGYISSILGIGITVFRATKFDLYPHLSIEKDFNVLIVGNGKHYETIGIDRSIDSQSSGQVKSGKIQTVFSTTDSFWLAWKAQGKLMTLRSNLKDIQLWYHKVLKLILGPVAQDIPVPNTRLEEMALELIPESQRSELDFRLEEDFETLNQLWNQGKELTHRISTVKSSPTSNEEVARLTLKIEELTLLSTSILNSARTDIQLVYPDL